ncbi:MAG: DUF4124 domain-containing protein [Burkholderiales bacterium PBB4]|nr:MAG: DUF4124 domain-containing protein [Burkholderiales bacterium PBB4]
MPNRFFLILIALALHAAITPVQAQGVYKWVDAEGKTHYGSQPPSAAQQGEALKMHSNSGFGGNNNGSSASRPVEYNPDGTKKIPKDVQAMAKGLEKTLRTPDAQQVPLDCNAAVSNAREQADTMLEVSAKNLKDGYITQADHEQNAQRIGRAKSETTLSHCLTASGKDKSFYQCMSNGRNHVTACVR